MYLSVGLYSLLLPSGQCKIKTMDSVVIFIVKQILWESCLLEIPNIWGYLLETFGKFCLFFFYISATTLFSLPFFFFSPGIQMRCWRSSSPLVTMRNPYRSKPQTEDILDGSTGILVLWQPRGATIPPAWFTTCFSLGYCSQRQTDETPYQEIYARMSSLR